MRKSLASSLLVEHFYPVKAKRTNVHHVVPVHTMKAYGEWKHNSMPFNLGTRSSVVSFKGARVLSPGAKGPGSETDH